MSYGSEAAALNALLSIFAGFWLVILAFFVLNIVAGWKIFEKAGQPGVHRPVLQQLHPVQNLLGQRLAVLCPHRLHCTWRHPAARHAAGHRWRHHQHRNPVQTECRVWAGDWLHHWPVLSEPHLQHDSGVRSVSVLRYPAGWLFL